MDSSDLSNASDAPDSEKQGLEAASLERESETEALKQRILELEEKVADLEAALDPGQRSGSLNVRELRRQVKPILFLLVIILLAFVPSALVFKDRWLGNPFVEVPLVEAWRKSSFLNQTALPSYFIIIFACMILLLALMLSWKETRFLVVRSEFPTESPDDSSAISPDRFRTSKVLFGAAGVIYLLTFIYGWSSQLYVGWGYFLAILLYGSGWLLREVSLREIARFWSLHWEWIVSFLIFHIALILFMAEWALKLDTHWVFALLLLLSLGNLARHFRRIPAILWVVNLAVFLFLLNINSWAFSVIGDDFGFYMKAMEIARTQNLSQVISSLFDVKGVYGSHPYFSSLLQAISMKLWGSDSFGWRFSSLYLSAISILFFYLFYKSFVPKSTALLSSIFLAASSYIMSFGKVGYNNLQSLFAMSVVLAAAAWAIKTKRLLAYVVLGLGLGFCLYVYPAALYILPLPILLLLFYYPPRSRQAVIHWSIMIGSFSLLFWPLLPQPGYWTSKLPGLFVNNPEIMGGYRIAEHVTSNLLTSFLSFVYISSESHFVAVSYLDPLSAIFVLLGLIYIIRWAPRERFFVFILVGFLILLLLVGASHDRRFPPTTRMFLLLPWYTLFVAVGLQWLMERLASLNVVRFSRTGLYAAVILAIIGFNLYQAYPLSQRRSTGNQTMEVLFVRLMERLLEFEPQVGTPKTVLFITEETWGIDGFYWLLRVYEYPASKMHLARMAIDGPGLPKTVDQAIADRDTLVIVQPDMNDEWQEEIRAQLESLGKHSCDIKEVNNRDKRFELWYSPGLEMLCSGEP